MDVIINEIANTVNFTSDMEGKLLSTHVFSDDDILGIVGYFMYLLSQKEDILVKFSEM